MDKSFTRRLAAFIGKLEYDDLEPGIVSIVKTCIIDALACSCGGYRLPWSQAAIELAHELSDKQESTIWFSGIKTAAPYAALANGVLAHSIIQEDMHSDSASHPGTIVISTALALGEKLGCDGKQIITAIVCGYEAIGRLGKAMFSFDFYVRGFRPSGHFGPFGSASVAAKLLQLNEDQTVNALGLAGNCSAGVNEWANAGTHDIYFHNGFASRDGIIAALLAQKGVRAPEFIIEGKAGLANAWGSDSEKVSQTFADAEEGYEIKKVYHKTAPSCALTQETVQAALKLIKENPQVRDTLDKIRTIKVSVYTHATLYPGCNFGGPFTALVQAQMSLQFGVASVLFNGAVNIKHYLDYSNPHIYDIARKIEIIGDPEAAAAYPDRKQSKIEVVMENGMIFSSIQADFQFLTDAQIIDRFKSSAQELLDKDAVDKLVALIGDFERLANVSEVTDLLAPSA